MAVKGRKKKTTAPVAAPVTPATEQPPVTFDNLHEHPNTPPDMLHSFMMDNATKLANKQPLPDPEKYQKALSHPNLSSDTISAIYQAHYKPKPEMGNTAPAGAAAPVIGPIEGNSNTDHIDYEHLRPLLLHPNSPASVTEDFLKSTYLNEDRSDTDLHSELSQKKLGINKDVLKSLTIKQINSPDIDSRYLKSYANLEPSFYNSLSDNLPSFEPEFHELNSAQKLNNELVTRAHTLKYNGLAITNQHTSESLAQAVHEIAHTNANLHLSKSYALDIPEEELAAKFIKSQPKLSSSQLEEMYSANYGQGGRSSEAMSAAVEHPNADPAFLARIVQSGPTDEIRGNLGSSFKSSVLTSAIASPRLPQETYNAVIDNPDNFNSHDILSSALNSPHATPEVFNKILANTESSYRKRDIICHEKCPPEVIAKYWETSDKKTDAARSMLKTKNVSPEVLTQLVNHSNQTVAVEALQHKNVNEAVVKSALKRRAPAVQTVALKHPLAPTDLMIERVKSGKIPAISIIKDRDSQEKANSPEIISAIHSAYQDTSEESVKKLSGATPADFWSVKKWLATNPKAPQEVRNDNIDDIIKHFESIAPEDATDIASQHSYAMRNVKSLAEDHNNHDAQQSLLKRPQILSNNITLSHKAYDADFLDQAYDKLAPLETDINSVRISIHEIQKNPNLSSALADKLIRHPGIIEESPFVTHSQDEGVSTLADMAYKDLPDNEKRDKFTQLLASGNPAANYMAVSSQHMPKDMFERAFMGLDSDNMREFLRADKFGKIADDNTKLRTAQLKILPGHPGQRFRPALAVLRDADVDTTKGANLVKEFVKAAGAIYGLDEDQPLDYSTFLNILPNDAYKNKALVDEVTQFALSVPNKVFTTEIGSHVAVKDAISKNYDDLSSGIPSHIAQGATKALSALRRNLSNLPQGLSPEDQSNVIGNRWIKALTDHFSQVRLIANRATVDSGQFDFLATMDQHGADTASASELRRIAISHDLLSPAFKSRVQLSSPDAFAQSLRSGAGTKDLVTRFITSEHAKDPAMLNALLSNIQDLSAFSLHGTSSVAKHKQENYLPLIDGVSKLADHILATPSVPNSNTPALMTALTSKVLRLNNDSRHKLVDANKNASFVKLLVDKVKTSAMPESDKMAMLVDMDRQVSKVNANLVPAGLIGELAKVAVKNHDVKTIVALMSRGKATGGIGKHFEKMLRNPAALSHDDLKYASGLVANADLSASSLTKLTSIALSRAAELSASPNEVDKATANALYNGYLFELSAVNPLGDSNEDNAKKDFVINTYLDHQHLLSQMDESLRKKVPMLARSANISDSQRKRLFMEGDPNALAVRASYSELSKDFVNDPGVLQSAVDGWKLKALMDADSKMTLETHALISSRIATSASLTADDKAEWLQKTLTGGNASEEEVIKQARAFGNGTLGAVLKRTAVDLSPDKLAESNLHMLLDQSVKELEDLHNYIIPVQGSQVKYDNLHSGRVLESVQNIANILAKYPNTVDIANAGQKQGAVDDAIDRAVAVLSNTISGISNTQTDEDRTAAINAASRSFGAFFDAKSGPGQRRYNNQQSDKLIDTLHSITSLADSLGEAEVGSPEAFLVKAGLSNKEFTIHAKNYFENAMPSDSKWPEILQKMPELTRAIPFAPVVPYAAIKAINFDKMLEDKEGIDSCETFIGQMLDKADMKGRSASFPGILKSVMKSENASSDCKNETLQKVINSCPDTISPSELQQYIGQMTPSKKTLETIAHSGAGGPEILGQLYEKHSTNDDVVRAIALSPHITKELASKLMASNDTNMMSFLAYNQWLPQEHVAQLVQTYKKSHQDNTLFRKGLCLNRNISKAALQDIYESTKNLYGKGEITAENCHPALLNPRHGLELFESLEGPKTPASDIPNVEKEKMVTHVDSPQMDTLRRVLSIVSTTLPSFGEGIGMNDLQKLKADKKISQKEFDDVKATVFKNKMKATPEDFIQGMRSLSGKGDFSISFGRWGDNSKYAGTQRHMLYGKNSAATNLVVQLNTPKELSDQLAEDPKFAAFWRIAQTYVNKSYHGSAHPVGPHTIGWSRVDTSGGKKGWIVEEYQTDLGYDLIAHFDEIVNHVAQEMSDAEGLHLNAADAEGYVKKIHKIIEKWQPSARKAIETMAKNHGCEAIYQHGLSVRLNMSGHHFDRPVAAKMSDYYHFSPIGNGYEPIDYSEYPQFNDTVASGSKRLLERESPRSIEALVKAGQENTTETLKKYGINKHFPEQEEMDKHMSSMYASHGMQAPKSEGTRPERIAKYFQDIYQQYGKCWKKKL